MSDTLSERPVKSQWTCPHCEGHTVRLATKTRYVIYYGCGAVSIGPSHGKRFGPPRACWNDERPLPPGCEFQIPAPADPNRASGEE
jgi:hypothetical protein